MRRFAWFDCLRCLAVLLVFLHHGPEIAPQLPAGLSEAFLMVQRVGWAGVDLFFVLSGFLVSGLLFEEFDATGSLDIRRFLIRRGFKIIPPFYVLVFVTVAYDLCVGQEPSKKQFLYDIFFLQSYLPGPWSHAWTLALEVHFYILLAALLAFLSHRNKGGWLRPLPWILGAVIVGTIFIRLANSFYLGENESYDVVREIQNSHLHLDVLAAGVLLRYLYNYHPASLLIFSRARWFWLAGAFALVWPSALLHLPHTFYDTALMSTFNWIAFFILVYQATLWRYPESRLGQWLAWPFSYMGKHSYSVYLWHLPMLIWVVNPLMPNPSPAKVVVFIALGIAVGCVMSEILEMPVLKLRNRIFPSATREKLAKAASPEAAGVR